MTYRTPAPRADFSFSREDDGKGQFHVDEANAQH